MQGCTGRGVWRGPWCRDAHAGMDRAVPGEGWDMQRCMERSVVKGCICKGAHAVVHEEVPGPSALVQACACRGTQGDPWCWYHMHPCPGGSVELHARAGVHGEVPGAGVTGRSVVSLCTCIPAQGDVHVHRWYPLVKLSWDVGSKLPRSCCCSVSPSRALWDLKLFPGIFPKWGVSCGC